MKDLVLPPVVSIWRPRERRLLPATEPMLWTPPDRWGGRYVLSWPQEKPKPILMHFEMRGRWVDQLLRDCYCAHLKKKRRTA